MPQASHGTATRLAPIAETLEELSRSMQVLRQGLSELRSIQAASQTWKTAPSKG